VPPPRNIPIRIGVNGGSLEKELLARYGGVTAEALVESAMGHVALLNRFDFDDICITCKCSDVPLTMAAYRLLHERTDYPLHLGVTEAGTPAMGLIKSAMGIGGLLCLGIGDTLRVTLTAEPEEEVDAAQEDPAAPPDVRTHRRQPGGLPHLRPHADRPDPHRPRRWSAGSRRAATRPSRWR
jgi:4-hydroxy-3-methylbut-2-en-1-yl diphosphate synthase IspG/GcpE